MKAENSHRLSRIGNFSSSAIYRLINPVKDKRPMTQKEMDARPKTGKGSRVTTIEFDNYNQLDSVALNYITEKVRECKLNRSINNNVKTSPIVWGKIIEMYVFSTRLGIEYRDGNHIGRLVHPKIDRWTGIPDFLKGTPDENSVVADLKCQSSLTRFCDLVDHCENGLNDFKENHKDHYWQLISNAILSYSNKCEFMFFVPYASELPKILEFVQSMEDSEIPSDISIWQVKRISDDIIDFMDSNRPPSFAYLPDDSDYKDLNILSFEVPQEDKELLTERVKMAVKELEKQLGNG